MCLLELWFFSGYVLSNGIAGLYDKESECNPGNLGLVPGLRRFPGEGNTPVFLPGEFHRQRSLVDYSLWGYKESDTT